MHIRRAGPDDSATIAELNIHLAAETEDLKLDPERVNAGVLALLRDPSKGSYFVCETENSIVGQVMITYEWSDWRNGNIWWLQSVYIRPEFRQKGVFRALFEHIRDLAAVELGVWGLRLYMHAANERARLTYERLGMVHTHYEVFEMETCGARLVNPASTA
jgi:GNAT superfamily N-acetyltransferase